jgi:hypothetical protein
MLPDSRLGNISVLAGFPFKVEKWKIIGQQIGIQGKVGLHITINNHIGIFFMQQFYRLPCFFGNYTLI